MKFDDPGAVGQNRGIYKNKMVRDLESYFTYLSRERVGHHVFNSGNDFDIFGCIGARTGVLCDFSKRSVSHRVEGSDTEERISC